MMSCRSTPPINIDQETFNSSPKAVPPPPSYVVVVVVDDVVSYNTPYQYRSGEIRLQPEIRFTTPHRIAEDVHRAEP